MNVLLVDNNDSFTYNIVELLRSTGAGLQVDVVRSDALPPDPLAGYQRVLLSPGPGTPSDFPAMATVIGRCLSRNIPLLGICLGHQAICEFFGGRLVRLDEPRHGWQVPIRINPSASLYTGLPDRIDVGLYHSWAVDAASLPPSLELTGKADDQVLMSVQHHTHPLYGVQFHPESFLSTQGKQILENFIGR